MKRKTSCRRNYLFLSLFNLPKRLFLSSRSLHTCFKMRLCEGEPTKLKNERIYPTLDVKRSGSSGPSYCSQPHVWNINEPLTPFGGHQHQKTTRHLKRSTRKRKITARGDRRRRGVQLLKVDYQGLFLVRVCRLPVETCVKRLSCTKRLVCTALQHLLNLFCWRWSGNGVQEQMVWPFESLNGLMELLYTLVWHQQMSIFIDLNYNCLLRRHQATPASVYQGPLLPQSSQKTQELTLSPVWGDIRGSRLINRQRSNIGASRSPRCLVTTLRWREKHLFSPSRLLVIIQPT